MTDYAGYYSNEYLIQFSWPDGRMDQCTIHAQSEADAIARFEQQYPGCVWSQILNAQPMKSERAWY